ncbi:NHLM bacteriocin system ABC transporter, ATP-binding protein (fragment) [Hyella patelloides LEGE 07179]|uniref:NHLM bacteriocin system ABC transporter, ATP-binding protein n=1 Tax=Hyella patelloides LEGE 07179 TaxID=945734 RepID=A0A563VW34_9CYAN
MVKSNLTTKYSTAEIFLKGNQLLSLDTSETFWFVRSGSVGIFAVTADRDRHFQGARQYLFTVKPGEALFGVPLIRESDSENLLGMVAVAIEATQLQAISLQSLMIKVKKKDRKAIVILESWLKHLNQWLAAQQTITENIVAASGANFFPLTTNQTLQPPTDEIVWIEVRNGTTHWLNREAFPITANSPPFPLTSSMGLTAVTKKVEVATVPTAELEQPEQLPRSLALLHRYFLIYFFQIQQQKIATEYKRFQQRNQLNLEVAESAFGKLANVLDTKVAESKVAETKIFESGNSLLIAAGAVGRAKGMKINPPSDAEELNRVKDPLDAIARASLFRTRRVILEGKWWQEEYGALLGYRLQDRSPIALLPKKNNHLNRGSNYFLFDPESRQKREIDAVIADDISPEAYLFYRPLPPLMYKATEIFRFGVQGHESEVIAIFVLGIIGSLLGMVTPQATAMLVNNAIPDGDRILLWQIGLALFAAAFGKTLFQLAQGFVSLRVENAADSNLQPAVWDKLLQLSPAFFRQYSSGDLVTRLMAVSQVRGQLSGATQRTLLSSIFALLNLVLMFVYSVKLAFVGLGIAILTRVC